jgi:hypothetical protein
VTVATERRCENESCHALLASTSRPDRRYCSDSCRQLAYQRRRGPASRPSSIDRRRDRDRATLIELERVLASHLEEPHLVALIAKAARSQWRAAAWILERRYPERWGVRRDVRRDEPPDADTRSEDDPFAEVVALAERRRERNRRGKS